MPRVIAPYSTGSVVTNMSLYTASLDYYIFTHNPAVMKRIRKKRYSSTIDTLESSAYFDWGCLEEQDGLIGRRYELVWPYMPIADWNEFKNYYESTETVIWDAQRFSHDGTKLYEVVVISLDGRDMPQNTTHKKSVSLVLEIRKVRDRSEDGGPGGYMPPVAPEAPYDLKLPLVHAQEA